MKKETCSERNRRRREQNAFENFYAYARATGVPDPKRTAERAARRIHGADDGGASAPVAAAGPSGSADSSREGQVPHRLEDRTKDQLYARAQDLDVDGRSQMNKDELIDAIRNQ